MTPRSIATIKAQIIAEKNAQADLAGLTSTSQTAIWNLLIYIQAVAINLFEQVMAAYESSLEAKIATAAPGTDYWLQQKILNEFQYDATTPQVITLVNFVPKYAVVDATKRIITRCSVKTTASKTVSVKVAKSDPPVALSVGELSALTSYLTNGGNGTNAGVGIGSAGVYMGIVSLDADRLFLEGTIKYDGQYSATILANVIAAINSYFANLEFDGTFKTISLVDYIQTVPGVTDVAIVNLAIRANLTAFGSKTYLIQGSTVLYTSYPLFAGYIIEEDTAGQTFTDKLTFTPNA